MLKVKVSWLCMCNNPVKDKIVILVYLNIIFFMSSTSCESSHDDIVIMVEVKGMLERLDANLQKPAYKSIVDVVNGYINTQCSHYIVTDTIDIDLDRSKTIYYCDFCFQTFTDPALPPRVVNSAR